MRRLFSPFLGVKGQCKKDSRSLTNFLFHFLSLCPATLLGSSSFGSPCLTHPQTREGPNMLVNLRSQGLPQFPTLPLFLLQLLSSQRHSLFYLVVLFTSFFLKVKSSWVKKKLVPSRTFFFSFPSTYFHPIAASFAGFLNLNAQGCTVPVKHELPDQREGRRSEGQGKGRTVLKPSTGYRCICQPHV